MQKYIFILLTFFYFCATGQKFPVKRVFDFSEWYVIENKNLKKGDYFKDKEGNYNPYIGTWYYKKNDLIFILKLQKVRTLFISNKNKGHYWWHMDRLQSTFKIIKNDVVLVNNLNEPIIETFFQKEKKETDKYGSFMLNSNKLSLIGQLRDTSLRYFSGSIYLIDTHNKIKLNLDNISAACKHSVMENEPICLLPKDIELSRYKIDN